MRAVLVVLVVALVLAQVAEGVKLSRLPRTRAKGLTEVDEELLEVRSFLHAETGVRFGSAEHWAIGAAGTAELTALHLPTTITVSKGSAHASIPADFLVAYQGDFLDNGPSGPFCKLTQAQVKSWVTSKLTNFDITVYNNIKKIVDKEKVTIGAGGDNEPTLVGGTTGENWDQDMAIASRGGGLPYLNGGARPRGSYLEDVVIKSSPYIDMAARNFDHFHDQDCAVNAYKLFHGAAHEFYAAHDNNSAIYAEFASYHYLTDLFAGGHARTPRTLLNNICSAGSAGDIAAVEKKLAGVLSKCQHDEDNAHGVKVNSVAHPTAWTAYGDDHYYITANRENQAQVKAAVKASFHEIFHAGGAKPAPAKPAPAKPAPGKPAAKPPAAAKIPGALAFAALQHVPKPDGAFNPMFRVKGSGLEVRQPLNDTASSRYIPLVKDQCLDVVMQCYHVNQKIRKLLDPKVLSTIKAKSAALFNFIKTDFDRLGMKADVLEQKIASSAIGKAASAVKQTVANGLHAVQNSAAGKAAASAVQTVKTGAANAIQAVRNRLGH